MKKSLGFVLLASALCSGCISRSADIRGAAPPEERSPLFLYIEPIEQAAQRLSFRIDGIAAVREDGTETPLSVFVRDVGGGEPSRERLLASGDLPAARYTGLLARVSAATLKGEDGTAALLISGPAQIDFPFAAAAGKALVLRTRFLYRDSLGQGFVLTPTFSTGIPGPIASGAIGLVTSRGSEIVTFFDKTSAQTVGAVPMGRRPAGIALDETRRRAYVAISADDALDVLDLLEGRVIERLQLNGGDRPTELALSLDGRTLLSANSGSSTVSVIDTLSLFERMRVSVGNGPSSVLFDRSGRRAFVFNTLSDSISIIDVPSGTVAATVSTEAGPIRGRLDRQGERLYVIYRFSPYLSVFDAATLSVVGRVHLGEPAAALAVDPRTGQIYLARRSAVAVDVYDPLSLLPLDTVPAGARVGSLAIDGERSTLYILMPDVGRVRMVGLVGKRRALDMDVGEDPQWVAFMGERP